jgi:protein-L-isoaspartate(D-aspartate) O-methyltransferase
MTDLTERRRFYAEEIEAVCNLQTAALVEALASVPRERFLPPGPWTVLSPEAYFGSSPSTPRTTKDADPKRVYHNIGIAIEPARHLFNGHPGTLLTWIDALQLTPAARILHIGCGLGYYTAIMAHAVGPTGRVLAFEVDEALARGAREALGSCESVDVRHGDASGALDETFDAIFVNAGVTHPLDIWLDALAPSGRMMVPLTAAMGPTLGKGLMWQLTKSTNEEGRDLAVRAAGMVAIYSAAGVRDTELNVRLGKAMAAGPAQWAAVTRLRRDRHEISSSCWLHGASFCFSSAAV